MDEIYEADEWMAEHDNELRKYAGKWIAVTARGVVASSDSFKELMKIKGDLRAIVTRQPTEKELDAIWIL